MLSGRRLDLLDPSPLDIEIEDIAHGLARVARWNGQTSGPHIFSVAQHSLLVEAIAAQLDTKLTARARLFILLHDAPEYVVGDMISPFKSVMGITYKAVEERILSAVLLRLSLETTRSGALTKLTKRADRAAAFFEATRLAGFAEAEAEQFFGRPRFLPGELEAMLAPTPSDEIEEHFLARFRALEAG
jgi:5'-deoxynucleotidase YfbR-like HD superfamily hydrolase